MNKSENWDVLKDFIAFCADHPELRFWQALLGWSKEKYIILSKIPPYLINSDNIMEADLTDTYHFKGKSR